MGAIIITTSVLLFVITAISLFSVYFILRQKEEHDRFLRKIEREAGHAVKINQKLPEKLRGICLKMIQRLGTLAKPKEADETSLLQRRFMQAGLSRTKNIMMIFYGSKVVLAATLPILFSLFRFTVFFRTISPLHFLTISTILALVGFYIPVIWLRLRIKKRKEQILLGFPDSLDLMVVCTEAGMGLDSAINRVGEEIKARHPVLSEELKYLTLELRAGKLRRDALRNLAMRCDLDDIQSFATLLIQTEKFGTNIAQAMRVQADSMRSRRLLAVEELAAKLPVKIIFPTIIFIFPSLFLVLMGPALIRAVSMLHR